MSSAARWPSVIGVDPWHAAVQSWRSAAIEVRVAEMVGRAHGEVWLGWAMAWLWWSRYGETLRQWAEDNRVPGWSLADVDEWTVAAVTLKWISHLPYTAQVWDLSWLREPMFLMGSVLPYNMRFFRCIWAINMSYIRGELIKSLRNDVNWLLDESERPILRNTRDGGDGCRPNIKVNLKFRAAAKRHHFLWQYICCVQGTA